MGKVNVVRPDGVVVSVDEDLAKAAASAGLGSHKETIGEEEARRTAAADKEKFGGPLGALAAYGVSALDTASLGLVGKGLNAAFEDKDPGFGEADTTVGALLREHPIARTIGSIEGVVADPFSAFAVLGKAGEAVKAVTGSKLAGRAAEGALVGAGSYVADTNVTGDPLTVEGLVQSVGVGGLVNVGIGALGDGLVNAGWSSKKALAEAAAVKAEGETAKVGQKLFKEETPSWGEFRDAYEASQHVARDANRMIGRDNEAYDTFVGSNKKVTEAIKSAERTLGEISGRFAPEGAPTTFLTTEGNEMVQGALTRQPMSPELAARVKDFDKRISDAYKTKGGGWAVDGKGEWVRDASVKADPEKALELYRSIAADLKQQFPKASGRLAEIPAAKTAVIPYEDIALPGSLRDFAKMRPDTIERMANSLDEVSSGALAKVVQDVGVEVKENPGATLAALHKKMGDYLSVLDKAAAEGGEKAAGGGVFSWLRSGLKGAAAGAAGFATFGALGGGIVGAGSAAVARTGARTAMGAVEDSVLGGVMVGAKETLRQKISSVVAAVAEPVGQKLIDMAPVTSYLAASFPSGKPDPEKDTRKLARNRIADLHAAASVAPDAVYSAVKPMLGHPSAVAMKVHQQIIGALQHMVGAMPQDPGTQMTLGGSSWMPNLADSRSVAYRLEAIQNPLGALQRALNGQSTPEAIDTLWKTSPAMMQEAATQLISVIPQLPPSMAKARAFSMIFRTPLSGLQQGDVVMAIQGHDMPKPSQSSTPSKSGNGGVGGRPPAISNPVAGSSVGSLLSQQ